MAKNLNVIFLGGIGEIGKNMTAIEYNDNILVVDAGLTFASGEMPGVDYIIPDFTYLEQNKEKIKGVVITHGHEDHIGALPYFLKDIKVPVYGSNLTIALINHKLDEQKINDIECVEVTDRDVMKIGCFRVEFVRVTHSIAGAFALNIETPKGNIFFTGDFKIDLTPIDNRKIDLTRIAEIGEKGVLLLLQDSANVERPGYTMSERTVGYKFNEIFAQNMHKRIIVATFASNIHRVQQIINCALKYDRKIVFSGKSLENISKIAYELGELKFPQDKFSSFSVIARSRTSATIRMAFSDNVNQITLSVGTTSNEVQNITSGKTFDLPITKSGLVSGTNYTLTVKVRDTSNGGYNSNQSYRFSTAAFVKPTVVMTPSLSKMKAVYTIVDSCKMEGSSTIRKSGEKVSVVFDKTSGGGALSAGTSYTFTTNFIDEFKTGNVPVAATATTSTIPTISSYNAVPNTISSLIGAYPQLGINLSDTRYEKIIRYTIGGKNYSQTVPIGGSQASHLLTKTQVEDILRTTPTTRSPVKVEVFFSEGGVQSPSTRVSTLDLTLLGTILNVSTPVEGSLIYSPAGGLNLTALVSSSINEMTATVPVQETPLGSTIVKEVLLFQNKVYTLNSSREVTISNVNTFNAGRTFQIEITDSRGLVNRKEFAVSTFEYSNPVLSVSEIVRSNSGFGEDLIMNNFGAVWSSPPTTGDKNKLKGILLRVTNQAGVTDDYGIVIPDTDLETAGTGQITKTFPSTEILSKSLESIGKVFLTNYAYRLTFVAQDLFGREALIRDYAISTGEPAMFIDSANRVVGFSTVAPRGAAEVNGDFYATKQFSLNGLFFSESDLTDL